MVRFVVILVATPPLLACAANLPAQSQPAAPTQASGIAAIPSVLNKTFMTGDRFKLNFYSSVHPDCTLTGYPIVRLVVPPSNGSLTTEQATDYPGYPSDNQRYECNRRQVPGTRVLYLSQPDFVGTDTAVIEVIFPSGDTRTVTYNMTVK